VAWISVQNKLISAPDSLQTTIFMIVKPFQKRILCGLKEIQFMLWIAQKAHQNKHMHDIVLK